MLDFDEQGLIDKLESVSPILRTAFAAACAARQLSNYEAFATDFSDGRAMRFSAYVEQLWAEIEEGPRASGLWTDALGVVMAMSPTDDEADFPLAALAEDASASLAYAIRCCISHDSQEAAWAARRAYEAADQAAIVDMRIHPRASNSAEILAHRFVQLELKRQQRDIGQLLSHGDSGIKAVRDASSYERMLDQSELAILVSKRPA